MIPCKAAGIAFLGGAALALLSGCAQSPMAFDQSGAAMRAYLNAEALAQRNAATVAAQQYQRDFYALPQPGARAVPSIAPVPEAPPRPKRFNAQQQRAVPADDSPVISENPPMPPVPVAVKAPVDPRCVGWWRVCKFL